MLRNFDFIGEALKSSGSRTIRFRIVTLVLLILLPLLALFGWAAFNLADAQRALIEMSRADVADKITARADIRMADATGKLTGLAATFEPERDDAESFRRDARGLLLQREFARIWSFDRTGKTIAQATEQGYDQAKPSLDGGTVRRTLAGDVVVSNVDGEGLDHATFVVSVPIVRSGKVIGGVAAEMRARLLEWILPNAKLADRWIAAIVDREGRFVARSLSAEQRVGRLASPNLKTAANASSRSGMFENVTLEGERVLNSFSRSEVTGWTTVVAVPADLVNAPLWKSALLVGLVGAGALLLTLLASFAYARRISEPVRNIGEMARAFASGKRVQKPYHALAELDEVQQALDTAAAESAHLAALVVSSGDAIMSMDLNGIIRSWNPSAEVLFGYTSDEIIGKPKSLLVPPDRHAEHRQQQALVAAGESLRSETTRLHRDGTPIPVSVDAAPIRRPDGTIIGTSSIVHDITERIAGEEHLQFLMREIAHRSKNQLAIIQAIASQTARTSGTKQEFLDQFKARLQGLAASHDLLLKQNWQGAPLEDLIRRQIEAFVGDRSNAVRLEGPPAMLTAAAAEAIGLAMHELATNSAKYGALSVPPGKVDVVWRLLPPDAASEGERMWELSWREQGGPKVQEPTVTGFGTQVIKRTAAMAVSGTADLAYSESGLVWRLTFPTSAMRQTGPVSGTVAA
ncbi:MAG: sensor histidine kinase [Hyphomicrobiaceae bacterium]